MQINNLNSINFRGIYQTKQQPTSNPQAPKLNTLSCDTVSFSRSDDKIQSPSPEIINALLDAAPKIDLEEERRLVARDNAINAAMVQKALTYPDYYTLTAQNRYKETPLMLAKTPEQTQSLIDAGRKYGILKDMLTHQDNFGDTPLINARTPEQTQALIDAGKECGVLGDMLTQKNDFGKTPLTRTKTLEQKEIILNAAKSCGPEVFQEVCSSISE